MEQIKVEKQSIVDQIKTHLKNIEDDPRTIWGQGYCSALADYEIITESQFDKLVDSDNETQFDEKQFYENIDNI